MYFSGRNGVKLHYRIIGNGPKTMLAFHGYGQNCSHFQPMAPALGNKFTIYSFDLFYHGNSILSKKLAPLQKQLLAETIEAFLAEKKVDCFSLMGFSMGGKFVLSLLEAMAARIESIYLIAPDGIGTSFWYNVATYPVFLRQIFRHSVLKPNKFFGLLKVMRRSRMVDQGLLKFAEWQMNSLPKRLQVYRSWMGFRELTFDLSKITTIINQHSVRLHLFTGKHDRVINGARLRLFVRGLPNGRFTELNTGHTFLLQEVARFLKEEHKPDEEK